MAKVDWISGKKYDFTQENVDRSPDDDGVYALLRGAEGTIVYIGRGNIRERLQAHFGGDNPCISRAKPEHYRREVCSDSVSREKELLIAFKTVCNKKVG